MALQYWERVAYVVQVLLAGSLFCLKGKRKRGFMLKAAGSFIFFSLISYGAYLVFPLEEVFWCRIMVLSLVPIACYFYLYWVLEVTRREAILLTCYAVVIQHIAFDCWKIYHITMVENYGLGDILIYCASYFLCYPFIKEMTADSLSWEAGEGTDREMPDAFRRKKWISLCVLASVLLLVYLFSGLEDSGVALFTAGPAGRVLYRLVDLTCCIYILWTQIQRKEERRLLRENAMIRKATSETLSQYTIRRELIDTINRKTHDLKHQLRHLDEENLSRYLSELRDDILLYDTSVDVGNQSVNVVLMEKSMLCKKRGIAFTCLMDGRVLSFMRDEDIYALFGNILDNAIRAADQVEEKEKRIVSLRMLIQNQTALLQVQNYFRGSLVFEDGLPLTTREEKDLHGYGLKSVGYIAEKYEGRMQAKTEEDVFTLEVLLPLRETSVAS